MGPTAVVLDDAAIEQAAEHLRTRRPSDDARVGERLLAQHDMHSSIRAGDRAPRCRAWS